ncbi:MAG: M50 family metallopeptidase [Dethiobacteria bacterium]
MLRGTKLKINPYFFLFLLYFAINGRLKEVLIFFICISVHEFAHAFVARSFGISVQEIEVFPFGSVARIEGLLEIEPQTERRIAWAGPLANFLFTGIAMIFYANRYYLGPLNEEMVLFFIRANLVLAFFNLIPALPLDGGKILRSSLVHRFNYRKATEIAARLGKILAVFIFAGGLAAWFYGRFNIIILLVAVFIFLAASAEQNLAVYVFLRSLGNKEREMRRRGGLKGEQIIVNEDTRLLDIFKLFSPHRYHLVRIMEQDSKQLKGEIAESYLVEAAMEKGVDVPVKKIMGRRE